WRSWFGGIGAWLVWVLASSALMAATLAWNPIRAIVGRGALAASEPAPESQPRKRPRTATDPAAAALALEPPPEEMPAIADLADADAVGVAAGARKPRKKKTRADGDAADALPGIGGTMSTEPIGDELPPTELLTEVPARYGDTGKQELDDMGLKLMAALRTFRIEGQLVGRTTGPVVTQFEIEPAP